MHKKEISINKLELLIMNNSLNEVLHGFNVDNFQSVIGASRDDSELLLKQIDEKFQSMENEDEKKTLTIEFDLKEVQIIEKSIEKVKNELDEIDYTTRMGATEKEINDLLQKVSNIVKDME